MFTPSVCLQRGHRVLNILSHLPHTNRSPQLSKGLLRGFRCFPTLNTSIRSRFGRSVNSRNSEFSSTKAFDLGRSAIAAGAVIGLGSLCLYGLTSSRSIDASNLSILDEASVWPTYVRKRIHATYAYLAGSATIAALSALAMLRSPTMCRLALSGGWMVPIGMMVASMGAGIVCQMLPYPSSGVSSKHVAWMVFSASLGAMLMPVCMLGGPILAQAALYTGGIVGGLSIVAITAPSTQFLKWSGPLAVGLGVVVVSSLGSMFLSPLSRVGYGMAAISLYGGLVLFSGFLLYDTQAVIKRATTHPARTTQLSPYYDDHFITDKPFDPINNSIHILLDVMNIFVRLVVILSNGQRRK